MVPKNPPYKVVFMGCPDFAVPCLKVLLDDPDFDICCVYCMPDRPKGRGKKLAMTPVKQFALEKDIEVRTPSSFKKFPEEVDKLAQLEPDFLVVVAYGLILTQAVLDIPKIAPINVHGSLLPKYRGPAPIHYAILNGETETGNTIMLMNSKMDEGDMLAKCKVPITSSDTLCSIHDQLCVQGANLLGQTMKDFARGKITPEKQDHSQATYTQKISPQTAKISWQKSAQEIDRLIRAMCPFPGAWFEADSTRLKVFAARIGESTQLAPGTVISDDPKTGLKIACAEGSSIELITIQKPGKGKMSAADFLRGFNFKNKSLA